MVETIIKRDGRKQPFDRQKISNAITKAMEQANQNDPESIKKIADRIAELPQRELGVEYIQDVIELELMKSKLKATAKEYILYRDRRNKARGRKTADLYQDIIGAKSNDVTRENANMNADTPAGMMMKFASESSKPFVDDWLLSNEAKECVKNNYIHIHDKDYYPTKSLTCIQHPLNQILQSGFRAGHGASRPAKRIETASVLAAISLETVQNEMHK